jgi:hypothetical protein
MDQCVGVDLRRERGDRIALLSLRYPGHRLQPLHCCCAGVHADRADLLSCYRMGVPRSSLVTHHERH